MEGSSQMLLPWTQNRKFVPLEIGEESGGEFDTFKDQTHTHSTFSCKTLLLHNGNIVPTVGRTQRVKFQSDQAPDLVGRPIGSPSVRSLPWKGLGFDPRDHGGA